MTKVEQLIAKGATVDAKSVGGWTPLHFAACAGRSAVIEGLIAKSAHINARDENGRTPLHVAVRYGRSAIVKQLIAKRAVIEAKDKDGWIPLDFAACNANTARAEALRQGRNPRSPASIRRMLEALQQG